MNRDTHELAWTAGFFDGEGSTYNSTSPTGTASVRLAVAQVDTRPLMRIRDAVGFGSVNGPYQRKNSPDQPIYYYSVTSFEHTQAFIAMLWKYLSAPKREQAIVALKAVRESDHTRHMKNTSPVCKRGHPLTGPDSDVYHYTRENGAPGRQCRKCKYAHRDRQAEMLRRIFEAR
jgi:hypothetical protein